MNRRIYRPTPALDEPRRIDQGAAWDRWRDQLAMGLQGDPLEVPTLWSTTIGLSPSDGAATLPDPDARRARQEFRRVTRSA